MQIQKKNIFFFAVGVGGGGWGGGGRQGGCERRSKVFVRIQKRNFLEGGGSDQGLGWGRRG